MATAATSLEATLRDWIQANHVCWEVAPHREVIHGQRPPGFELTLYAQRPAACTSDPGCAHCLAAHERLREVLLGVLPSGTQHEVEAFDAAFHFRPENEWEPELQLVVDVQQESPELAKTVAEALGRLGARRGVWRVER